MILDQGVLKPRALGKQVAPRTIQKKEGLSIRRIERLLHTGKPDICVVRSLGGIGDVLMTTPFVRALKHKWPKGHITYATDFKYMDGALKDVLLYNPDIDELLQYQVVGSREYDLKLDVTSVCVGMEKPGLHVPNRIDLFANHAGVSLEKTGFLPTYIVSAEEKVWVQEKLSRYPRRSMSTPRIGIQVRSSTVSRSWQLDRVRDLAIRLMTELSAQVVVFDSSYGGGPEEQWNISGIVVVKDYKIRQVAALIDAMDLMITPDSGLMHIAGALNKKIVSIWAGSDPDSRINHYPNAIPIARKNYKCFPCWYNAKACASSYLCIKSITVDEVYDEVVKLLSAPYLKESAKTISISNATCIRRDLGGYGDVICTTCAIENLKKRQPDKDIIVATPEKYHCIFENNPYVAQCVDIAKETVPSNVEVFDLTRVDGQSEVAEMKKTGVIKTTRPQVYVRTVGGSVSDNPSTYVPKLYVKEEQIEWARKKFMGNPELTYILTPLEAAEVYRTWNRKRYDELFRLASEQYPNWRFVLPGGTRLEEAFPDNVIDATGFSFGRTIHLAAASDIILTPDTSLLHVAAALSKPCVALFGPIAAEARCQHYPTVTCIRAKLECIPCWRNATKACSYGGDKDSPSYCLEQISSTKILRVLEQKIEEMQ